MPKDFAIDMGPDRNDTRLKPGRLPVEGLPVVPAGQGFDLISGVTVLDMTSSIAGPYATMLLTDFGAEVIKVEKPGGDDARSWGPPFLDGHSLWFSSVNRNKKSVELDIFSPAGRNALKEFIPRADVFITNQPPSVQKKLGLDYQSLRALKQDIIFVSITGFGLTGERADFTCYDLIAEGYSGVMDMTGERDGAPQKIGAPAADMLAGQDAAMATLAALFDRYRSGKGRVIDISLVESMIRFLSCRVSSYLGSGDVPVRSGGTDSVIAIYQSFQTMDLPITLALGNDAIWKRFWHAVGEPKMSEVPHYATNSQRREHRQEIVSAISKILVTRKRDAWLECFSQARVPAGPIYRMDEVAADEALIERGVFFAMQSDSGELVPQVGLGIRIDGKMAQPRSVPPRLGQHTGEVL